MYTNCKNCSQGRIENFRQGGGLYLKMPVVPHPTERVKGVFVCIVLPLYPKGDFQTRISKFSESGEKYFV